MNGLNNFIDQEIARICPYCEWEHEYRIDEQEERMKNSLLRQGFGQHVSDGTQVGSEGCYDRQAESAEKSQY